MSGPSEVEIFQKPGGGWFLWLLNQSGDRASVEPFETFENEATLESWTRGYEAARLRMVGRPGAAQGPRRRRGPRRR